MSISQFLWAIMSKHQLPSLVFQEPSGEAWCALDVLETSSCPHHTKPNVSWPIWLKCVVEVQKYLVDFYYPILARAQQRPSAAMASFVKRAINVLDKEHLQCCQKEHDPSMHWMHWLQCIVNGQRAIHRTRNDLLEACLPARKE